MLKALFKNTWNPIFSFIRHTNKVKRNLEPMGQWSALPVDLLKIIDEHLNLYTDKVRIRSVCSSWQSNLPKMPNHKLCQLPWLLLPQGVNDETSFGFLNLLEKKVYNIRLPEPQGKLFRGSSHGWVVTVEQSPAIYAVNPLTGAQVQLPPRSTFPDVVKYRGDKLEEEYAIKAINNRGRFYNLSSTQVRTYFTQKIVLSSPPTSRDWVAVAIYGEIKRLAYCKYGDKRWSILHRSGDYSDVVFHKEKFFAIRFSGQVMVFDIIGSFIGSCVKVTRIVPPIRTLRCKSYLVESGGRLMLVQRARDPRIGLCGSDDAKRTFIYGTCDFKIYGFDKSNSTWCEVKNLGDDLFFVGLNSSLFALSSHDFPGYKGNCIYFTDDSINFHTEGVEGGYDVGVFNMDDGSFEPMPGYTCDSHLVWPPPILVLPNPYC